jgi:hypothetical protein
MKNGFLSLLSPIFVSFPSSPDGHPSWVRPAASGLHRRRSRATIEIFFLPASAAFLGMQHPLKRDASKFVPKSVA